MKILKTGFKPTHTLCCFFVVVCFLLKEKQFQAIQVILMHPIPIYKQGMFNKDKI